MKKILFADGSTADYPSCFSDLTPKMLRKIMRIYFRVEAKGERWIDLQRRMLFALLDYRPGPRFSLMRRRYPRQLETYFENIVLLEETLLADFFVSTDEGVRLNFDSLDAPFPRLAGRKGPGMLLTGLSFGRFRALTVAMNAYFSAPSMEALNEIVAILYVSDKDFEKKTIPLRWAARRPVWKKQTLLLWVCACVKHIQGGDFCINGETINLSGVFKAEGDAASGDSLGWTGVLFDLAEKQVFGTVRETDRAALFDVLALIYNNYLKIKEYERKKSR